ncbi:MAG: tetratricopeptide repeat protein [Deltaproteobacteria bacterium]|nr:tetratricopeptide repeat protein [Deltaproteobacteria bacterium]
MKDHDAHAGTIKKAMHLARIGRFRHALALFEKDARSMTGESPSAASYHALSLAVVRKQYHEALSLSLNAAKKEFYNPDIYNNIGKICLLMGRKDRAVRAFRKGLMLDKTHHGIIRQMKRLGIRRKPPLYFLHRGHIMNRLVGGIIYALRTVKGTSRGRLH